MDTMTLYPTAKAMAEAEQLLRLPYAHARHTTAILPPAWYAVQPRHQTKPFAAVSAAQSTRSQERSTARLVTTWK